MASGEIRSAVSAMDLLHAVAHLSLPVPGGSPGYSQRMIALLIDGLHVKPGGRRARGKDSGSLRAPGCSQRSIMTG